MKITVIGSGYVGLVTGACLADAGNHVLCLDVDAAKIKGLQAGKLPIYEPGLDDVVIRNTKTQHLQFTTDVAHAIAYADILFIAVGTPPDEDGSADLRYVLQVAQSIGDYIARPCIVVDKSTVPVGTGDLVQETILQRLRLRNLDVSFSVVSNPEFLKEGAAIADFAKPDRVIIGVNEQDRLAEHVKQTMRELYMPFVHESAQLMFMDRRSAELTKYAANAMLATRISFMNELALLAEKLDADIDAVRQGIGADPRIGKHFLFPGTGYGGSCFPKDVAALVHVGHQLGQSLQILTAVEHVNQQQKQVLIERLKSRWGHNFTDKTIGIWGLAFKPNTDDMREAPSRVVIRQALLAGAQLRVHDPIALEEAKRVLAIDLADQIHLLEQVIFCDDAAAVLDQIDALLICTEWNEYRTFDLSMLPRLMRQPLVVDGRNIYTAKQVQLAKIEYIPIGRRAIFSVSER